MKSFIEIVLSQVPNGTWGTQRGYKLKRSTTRHGVTGTGAPVPGEILSSYCRLSVTLKLRCKLPLVAVTVTA
jgi:hypothetical protein